MMSAPSRPDPAVNAAAAKLDLQAGPAGAAVLADQLRTAVLEMTSWMREFGDFTPHPSLTVSEQAMERSAAELRARLRDNHGPAGEGGRRAAGGNVRLR